MEVINIKESALTKKTEKQKTSIYLNREKKEKRDIAFEEKDDAFD